MPAKKGNHRRRGTFRHAGSSNREASLDSVRRSMLASPDGERSLTDHEDILEKVEEQSKCNPDCSCCLSSPLDIEYNTSVGDCLFSERKKCRFKMAACCGEKAEGKSVQDGGTDRRYV
eukprot:767370-Hanusia_phi.AAC.1